MPIYEYRCKNCNHIFEVTHGIDEPPPDCPNCGSKKVIKIITTVSFKVGRGETLGHIEKRFKDHVKAGKYKDAAKFAEKAAQYTKDDKIKKMAEEGEKKLLKKKK